MIDACTMASAERRHRLARQDVEMICLRRAMSRAGTAYRRVGAEAERAAEIVRDTVAAFDAHLLWESA